MQSGRNLLTWKRNMLYPPSRLETCNLKKEAVRSCETSVNVYHTTGRQVSYWKLSASQTSHYCRHPLRSVNLCRTGAIEVCAHISWRNQAQTKFGSMKTALFPGRTKHAIGARSHCSQGMLRPSGYAASLSEGAGFSSRPAECYPGWFSVILLSLTNQKPR